jgi:hypothetical protein
LGRKGPRFDWLWVSGEELLLLASDNFISIKLRKDGVLLNFKPRGLVWPEKLPSLWTYNNVYLNGIRACKIQRLSINAYK